MYVLKNALESENTTIRKAAQDTRRQNIRRDLISKETEKRLVDNNLTMDIDSDSAIMPLDKLGNGFIDYPDILRICKAVEKTTSIEDVVKKYLEESKSISIEDVVWRPIYEHDNSKSKYSSPSRKLPFGGITGVIYMSRNTNFGDQFDNLDAYIDYHYNRYLA
ncbi:MAG: hypothetical protein J6N72_09915, partial [Psychrobacter sp.]|nr:hypothetical protein [Psychrobacter sp.]